MCSSLPAMCLGGKVAKSSFMLCKSFIFSSPSCMRAVAKNSIYLLSHRPPRVIKSQHATVSRRGVFKSQKTTLDLSDPKWPHPSNPWLSYGEIACLCTLYGYCEVLLWCCVHRTWHSLQELASGETSQGRGISDTAEQAEGPGAGWEFSRTLSVGGQSYC